MAREPPVYPRRLEVGTGNGVGAFLDPLSVRRGHPDKSMLIHPVRLQGMQATSARMEATLSQQAKTIDRLEKKCTVSDLSLIWSNLVHFFFCTSSAFLLHFSTHLRIDLGQIRSRLNVLAQTVYLCHVLHCTLAQFLDFWCNYEPYTATLATTTCTKCSTPSNHVAEPWRRSIQELPLISCRVHSVWRPAR